MSWDFWRGRRVLITGNTGFKGSWLSLWLAKLGAQVRGYSLAPPTEPSLFELAGVREVAPTSTGDVRDQGLLAMEIARFAPEVVMHLAAQSVVFAGYENPIETFSTNVIGTATVLECVRRFGRRCSVVNVTTDKVYENRHWIWGYRENDRLGGRDPYSASKSAAELVARAYHESFFSRTAESSRIALGNARAGNVIGGGDWTAHQLVPEAVEAFSRRQPLVLRHPEATRPWQHVLDCLSGYLTLAQALHEDPGRYAGEWNFGPGDAQVRPVAQLVEMLASYWNLPRSWTQDPASHPHEEALLRLDSQKAHDQLHWSGRLSLARAVEWTAEWYVRHARGEHARALCEEQLDRYIHLDAA